MLAKLILIGVQAAAAVMVAPHIMGFMPASGDLRPLLQGVVFALIVWVAGLVGAFALKEVNVPSSHVLTAALIGALIGAGITMIPHVMGAIPLKVPPTAFPIAGAILGYFARR